MISTDICKNSPSNEGKLKIWSAASSTGQEAVSLAILIQEINSKKTSPISFSILGTDISDRVLTRAKDAVYTQLEVQRGLPAQLLIKYFDKTAQDKWALKSEIKNFLEFRKLNLKEPISKTEQFHLVLCRNVLIYQNVESKKEILEKISQCISDGGYLVLGSGESLLGLSTDFDIVSHGDSFIYRKRLTLAKAS